MTLKNARARANLARANLARANLARANLLARADHPARAGNAKVYFRVIINV